MKRKFTKYDTGKPRYSLLPVGVIMQVIKVFEYGAKKYSDDNWKKCTDPVKYLNAMFRHFEAYMTGERYDRETGYNHLAHAICCAMIVISLDRGDK